MIKREVFPDIMIPVDLSVCYNIVSNNQRLLIQKSKPKRTLPIKCYIYCTKRSPFCSGELYLTNSDKPANGNVIAEFTLQEAVPVMVFEDGAIQYWNFHNLHECGLTYDELALKIGKGKTAYGWKISDLVVYDDPVPLSEFIRTSCIAPKSEQEKCAGIHAASVGFRCRYMLSDGTCTMNTSGPSKWCYVRRKRQTMQLQI